MTFALHMELYDSSVAARKGKPGEVGFSFDGMTMEQCEAAQKYLGAIMKKLDNWKEREMGLIKHGGGEVIGEPEGAGDQQKEASKTEGSWTPKDDAELADELETDG